MKKIALASFIALLAYAGKTMIDTIDHITLRHNTAIMEVLR